VMQIRGQRRSERRETEKRAREVIELAFPARGKKRRLCYMLSTQSTQSCEQRERSRKNPRETNDDASASDARTDATIDRAGKVLRASR